MLSDDQFIDELRRAFKVETDGIDPPPGLLDHVRQELQAGFVGRRGRRRLAPSGELLWLVLSVTATVSIVAIALVLVRHGNSPNRASVTGPPSVGIAKIAARAPDPRGGVPWGLRTTQTGRLQACLQIGRLRSGRIGALGQDGAFGNDHRFHAIPRRANFPCGQTDARGYLFLNVFEREVSASASLGSAAGCRVGQGSRQLPACLIGDLRNVAYGVLGPDAVSVTYTVNHRTVTKRTGPDGAYIVVVPATRQSCTFQANGGRGCVGGSGEITTPTLQSGVITAVTYRDGHVCHLPTPALTGVKAASCPNVGYTHYPPFRPPHITAAQTTAPVTVHAYVANRLCYRPRRHGFDPIAVPCDHGVPRGYKAGSAGPGRSLLINIAFTARLAATNQHSVYEWSLGRSAGPSCAVGGGGVSATTMTPIRAGQHVMLQDTESPCPGTYTGLVTYQPNGWPGHDTLFWRAPIHDGSVLVGRFTFVVPGAKPSPGRHPTRTSVLMPDVLGLPLASATAKVRAGAPHVRIKVGTSRNIGNASPNTVIAQNPGPNNPLFANSTVTLRIPAKHP